MRPVVVIGSINVDIVYKVPHLPAVGETANAMSKVLYPGGKGYNQAVAASKAGIKVKLIGSVGDDDSGKYILESIRSHEIDTGNLMISQEYPSGEAIIFVDENGDNMIMVSGGINMKMNIAQLPIIENSIVLMQLEIPMEIIWHMIEAKGSNMIVLNLAPYREFPIGKLKGVDILVMNKVEASQLVGESNISPEILLKQIKESLPECIPVITLGKEGVIYLDQEIVKIPAESVVTVDTTGAGDTFTGLLAGLIDQMPFNEVMRLANRGAAISTTREGAQTGMPTLDEIKKFGGMK
jgi:ribokinase